MTRKVSRFSGGVYDLGLRVVWRPKHRRQVLGGRVAARLDELVRAKADERGWEIVTLEVLAEQVHLFVKYGPESSPSYVANQFKRRTSRALRAGFAHVKSRLPPVWSSSCFAATVGVLSVAAVQRYIGTQWERV